MTLVTAQPRDGAALAACLTDYIDGVLAGTIMASTHVVLGVKRHVRNRAEGEARGLRWNQQRALRACWWIEHYLCFSKDEWAGRPMILQPWQVFVVASIFGWERIVDGVWVRAIRTAYISLARKNGKTELAAAIALLMLLTGGASWDPRTKAPVLRAGREIYSAATKRDQAAICWKAAYRIIKRSPKIRKLLDIPRKSSSGERYNITHIDTDSIFRALASDDETLDGLGPYCAVIDELHAHKTGGVWDVLKTGMGAQREPLQLAITTRGKDPDGICGEVENDCIKILNGVYEDDTVFAFIACLDDDDDAWDETVWPKSNPNLGVSVHIDGLRLDARAAENNPRRRVEFLRKQMNLWTSGDSAWLNVAKWDACRGIVDLEALRGTPCYVGVDLASTRDTTAVCAIWHVGDKYLVRAWIFVPADTIDDPEIRGPRERELLAGWVREGLVIGTPGEAVDYDYTWAKIVELQEAYGIKEAVFDSWAALYLTNRCEQIGIQPVRFGQGYKSMSPAMKEAESMICHCDQEVVNEVVVTTPAPLLVQDGDPVLRWQFTNVATKIDPAENIKPDKQTRTKRIDGVVAMLMALARARADQESSVHAWVARVS